MDLDAKADMLAREGFVSIIYEGNDEPPLIVAEVQGASGTWEVELLPSGDATCDCPLFTEGRRRCAHIRAVRLYEQYGRIWAAERRARGKRGATSCLT